MLFLIISIFIIFLIYISTVPVNPKSTPKVSVYTQKPTLSKKDRPGTGWYNEFLFERPLIDHGIYTDYTTKEPLRPYYY